MVPRYLFGPVDQWFTNRSLTAAREAGDCLTFNGEAPADVVVGPRDSWQDIVDRLPTDWCPDFIALYLPYRGIPSCLWSAPVPRVPLAADWGLLWHSYRTLLRSVDLVLTDTPGVEVLAREGIAHARVVNLYGAGRDLIEADRPEVPRDIDVLFVGNLHPAVQRERLSWLGRLGRLAGHRRIEIHTGVFGEEYRRLLGRARIVFNRSIRGECNQRAFEAALAGALLFQEADNCEVPRYFTEGQEYIAYTRDNLEERLEYFLDHEEERQAIAQAARAKVRQFSFAKLWADTVGQIAKDLDALKEQASLRGSRESRRFDVPDSDHAADAKDPAAHPPVSSVDFLLARTWQAASGGLAGDPVPPNPIRSTARPELLQAGDLFGGFGTPFGGPQSVPPSRAAAANAIHRIQP